MREIIGACIVLAVLTGVAIATLVAEKKRNNLPEDDGIVWNTAIEERNKKQK